MKTILFKTCIIIPIFSMGLMSCSKTDSPVAGVENSKSVATLAPEKVTTSTAYIKGIMKSTEPATIIESGIFLSELSGAILEDPSLISGIRGKKFKAVNEGDGKFFVALTNLKADTRYAYVAYATTPAGTQYGAMKMLVTSYGTVKDADGNQYQTVRIGNQIWMRENLKSDVAGNYALETDETYGKHYSWDVANVAAPGAKSEKVQGACPTGWHVPADGEWKEMLSYLGVPTEQLNSLNLIGDNQAQMLKDGGSDFWSDDMANNATGFSVIPACIVCKCSHDWGCQAAFWTSTPNIFYGFQNESEKIVRGNHPDCTCGLSVRCVQD
jgi:uncharacterized protein (TIGR02145 family)